MTNVEPAKLLCVDILALKRSNLPFAFLNRSCGLAAALYRILYTNNSLNWHSKKSHNKAAKYIRIIFYMTFFQIKIKTASNKASGK